MKAKSRIASPCISVCTVDLDSGFCRGCFRTLDEIADWDDLPDEEKQELLKQLEDRKKSSGNTSLHC